MTRYERAAQIWAVLVLAARQRQVLTYEIVARAIGVPRAGLGQLLAPIQDYCLANDLPPLTVLVVSETTGLPSTGFIAAEDIPGAQARVFQRDWLVGTAPSPDVFASAPQSAAPPGAASP